MTYDKMLKELEQYSDQTSQAAIEAAEDLHIKWLKGLAGDWPAATIYQRVSKKYNER